MSSEAQLQRLSDEQTKRFVQAFSVVYRREIQRHAPLK